MQSNHKSIISKIHLSVNNPFFILWEQKRENLESSNIKHKNVLAKITTLGKITTNQNVCEIGCGFGQYLVDLASNFPITTYGIEYTQQYLELINRSKNEFGFQCNGICGDAVFLPLPNNCMDVVYSVSFFEHVYDIPSALREQLRIIKPGGRVIILISNLLNPKSFLSLVLNYWIKSKGSHGGIDWLFSRGKVRKNLYNKKLVEKNKIIVAPQRDEDIKSYWWWKDFLHKNGITVVSLDTVFAKKIPYKRMRSILRPFLGAIEIVLSK